MTQQETFEKVVDILKPHVKNESALGTVSLETNILDELKVNSARLVDVVPSPSRTSSTSRSP